MRQLVDLDLAPVELPILVRDDFRLLAYQFAQFIGGQLIEVGGRSWPTSCRQQDELTIVGYPNGKLSQNPDHPAIGQTFPGQAENQRVELPSGEGDAAIAWAELNRPWFSRRLASQTP